MYRSSNDGTSDAASFQPRVIQYTVPLDGQLQSRSLHPMGALQFNRPYASLSLAKIGATLALPSPSSEHDPLKLEALRQLNESLARPETVSGVLGEGVFAELLLNASNESPEVRVLATQALAVVTRHRAGREFALAAEITPRLAALADSSKEREAQVRRNVLQCFVHMGASAAGVAHLLERGVLRQLIAKLDSETDLATHAACELVLLEAVREPAAWAAAMADGVVATCARVLQGKQSLPLTCDAARRVRQADGVVATDLRPLFLSLERLAQLVAHVAAPKLAGKDACVQANIVPMLVELLSHPVPAVRIAASLALLHLTNCESGKVAALKCQALAPLIEAALDDQDPIVQCQAMQALANLAEHPKAKTDERMVAAVQQLKVLQQSHTSDKVRHAAQLAIDQITWQP